ncbi:MAG TPA: type II CAAX endopeptidase family protein [Saprospiraceae bacterium]|nr:type II CAAX endopeptidase family protein [Saprospiraceae bacterium]
MIGILIQLAVSWILLWLMDKKDLTVLGLKPTTDRLRKFSFGFIISAAWFTVYCQTTTFLTNNHWTINQDFSLKEFLSSTWWTFKSVIYEELIFRGAILFLLIQKTNIKAGCIISSVAFGVYHWFSFGVLGNPVQMTYIFLWTGIWGLMFAFAFAKTRSLYLPTGLHLGWNLLNIVVFSQGPLGNQFLIHSNNGQGLTVFPSVGLQIFQLLGLPIMVYLYLKNYRQSDHK